MAFVDDDGAPIPQDQILYAKFRRGLDVQQELRETASVRAILAGSAAAAVKAVDRFLKIDPTDVAAVIDVQQDLKRHLDIANWLTTVIAEGSSAEQALMAQDPSAPAYED